MHADDMLTIAARNGDLAQAQQALSYGGRVDAIDHSFPGEPTALWVACNFGRAQVARLLIERGADIGAQNQDGRTVLMVATKCPDVVQLLLERGAELEAVDNDGRTALWHAASRGHLDALRVLVEHGADVNHPAGWPSSDTPLIACARYGYVECARLLIEHRANLDATNCEHRTALQVAGDTGHLDVMSVLAAGYGVQAGLGWSGA